MQVGTGISRRVSKIAAAKADGQCQDTVAARRQAGRIGGYIYPADFRGRKARQDILLQVGEQNCVTLVALTEDLEPLWEYRCANGKGGHCPGIFDSDGDGRDKVAIGTSLLDHDGKVLWDLPFESFAAPWEDDHVDEGNGGDFNGDGKADCFRPR